MKEIYAVKVAENGHAAYQQISHLSYQELAKMTGAPLGHGGYWGWYIYISVNGELCAKSGVRSDESPSDEFLFLCRYTWSD